MDIKKVTYLLVVILFSLLYIPLLSQVNSPYRNITTSDGLSQGMVDDILQDRMGFLWFGTKDGLNRYDGYQFEVFINDPDDPWSIAGNTVTKLFEDSKGRIWVSLDNIGVDIYEPSTGRFHHVTHNKNDPTSISGSHVINILEDTSGYFILNIDEKEINLVDVAPMFDEERHPPIVIRLDMPNHAIGSKIPSSILKGISKDALGRIWVGGINEMYLLNVKAAELISYGKGFSFGQTLNNEDGTFWAAGNFESLFYWDGEKGTKANGSLSEIKFKNDKKGRVWALNYNTLYGYIFDQSILPPSSESVNDKAFFNWKLILDKFNYPFNSFAIDHADNIWIGTNGFGIFLINANQTKFEHHLPGVSIYDLTIVNDYKQYIKTYHGWYNENDKYIGEYPILPMDKSHHLENILHCKNGDILIKINEQKTNVYQVLRVSPAGKMIKKYDIPWTHYDSQPILEAQDGKIWIAGFDQILTCIDSGNDNVVSFDMNSGSRMEIKNEEKLLTRDLSTTIHEDNQGNIWVGTKNGMYKCTLLSTRRDQIQVTKHINIKGDKNSLSYNHVTAFMDDPIQPDRYIWICTKGGGINRMDKRDDTFIRMDTDEGLPDNVVYGVLSDENANIWGSTNKGLFCLLRSGLEQNTYHFKNFSKSDGLQEEEFNTGSYAKLPNGKLMFGGINGYNLFSPADVLEENANPQVHITDLKINNNKINTDEDNGILAKSILFTETITLQPKHEILTISFASLDFTDPLRNKYRYKMMGLDDSWIMAGNQRSATFVQLPAGRYTFMVEATDSHGVWSNQSDVLEVIVLPPWYWTWWAYATYIFLIVSVAYFSFRLYDRRQKLRQSLAYEKRESDRVRELEYQKSQLFMNMTHEFRTPLTIILGKAKLMKSKANEKASDGFEMIIRNGEHLLSMVNDMLDISKLNSGKIKINYTNTDIVAHLNHKLGLFKSLLTEKNIHLHFLPEMDSFIYRYDVQKMNHIISNLISNAIKFSGEKGHIYVMLSIIDTSLILKVKDTGSGISKEALPYIFDRFYQEDNSITRKSDGTGIGLALTNELVTLMNGNIKVFSPPKGASKGTEFVISLPCDKQNTMPVQKDDIDNIKNGTDTTAKNINPVIPKIQSSIKNSIVVEDQTATKQYTTSNSKNLIILVVEDNVDVREYVQSCVLDSKIFSNRKITLETAENGEKGLEKAMKLVPDLIISDVMMPLMDGFDLIERLKNDTATNHIPVILLTARADLKSKLEGLELGANAYLPKPFEPQELVYNIKNLIAYRDKIQQRIQKSIRDGVMPQENTLDAVDKLFPNQENKFVQKIQSYIEDNISDADLSVRDIAKEIHLSHSQFARKLTALTGYSPNQFIKTIRLAHAIKLLNEETSSITAISYDCGFNDPGYFIKVFKKEYGVTPGQWSALVKR